MEITEKLLKPITETKYLTTENAERYRTILRIFYLRYEKLKYWLYQEEVYEEMVSHDYFKDYTPDQCQQDLTALVNWKNLVTIQDTKKVSSIEEFKNKKFRYQMSEYSVEIERLVIRLENLFIEGASLEPTLFERIRTNIQKIPQMIDATSMEAYTWWTDLNNDFIRLNQNYQDYIRDLNGIKAEEMMKTREFLVFKDRLVEYLRNFVKGLQQNLGIIEEIMRLTDQTVIQTILSKVVEYELSIPRMDGEISYELLVERAKGRWESMEEWFVAADGQENEAAKLFDATNDIIRRITRYATQISELNNMGANRREEYAKVATVFLKCQDINEAHRMSAMVFGVEEIIHLKGEFPRKTDSANSGVYEEAPYEVAVTPRVRNYREKTNRSVMKDYSREKEEMKRKTIEEMEKNQKQIEKLIINNRISFANLPVLSGPVREILLNWISKALETGERAARTEEGRDYYISMPDKKETCVVHCEDGDFTMPSMELVFKEA